MLAIFLDVQNEILEITREFEVMQRKIKRFESAENLEDKDSHIRAIAGCIHGVYNGMEKILKDLINHIDGVLPAGDDWHIQLLRRAKYPNEGVRPAMICEETFISPDTLRGFRHVFRGRYHTNLIPELIIERANETLKAYPRFLDDTNTSRPVWSGWRANEGRDSLPASAFHSSFIIHHSALVSLVTHHSSLHSQSARFEVDASPVVR
jgi:hypothetical protein